MSKQEKRREQLLAIVRRQGMMPVRALADRLAVSEMTVRRDLEALKYTPMEDGIGRGAGAEYSLLQEAQRSNEQKARIGAFAATLIQENDVVIIDTGSTTARMLSHIPADKNLTVLCYNANVMMELRHRPGIRLLFCGGNYHRNTEMFESPEGIQFINRIRANTVFLSAAGVHRELGVTCSEAYEVLTKQAVMHSALQRILLVDSAKFGQLRPNWFCNIQDVDTIVADSELPQDWQDTIREMGIGLHLV